MENQVTLDRHEYDNLKEIEREAKTLERIMKDNEPLIVLVNDRFGEERFKVYSGRQAVSDLVDKHNARVEQMEKAFENLSEKYAEQEKVMGVIRAYLKGL